MNRRAIANGLLLVANALLGTWVVTSLYARLVERETEVEAVRLAADDERAAMVELERQVAVKEAVLDGLRDEDPYVIEFMARDRLGWRGDGEVPPPPLPEP